MLKAYKIDEPVDVLVIGAGLAGCVAALKAAEAGLDVIVLCRSKDLTVSNSAWAQGGIIYEGIGDTPELLSEDIFQAGGEIGRRQAIMQLAEEGPKRVREILLSPPARDGGIPFDQSDETPADGHERLSLTEEGAHSVPRIIHVGDYTGKSIQEHMIARLKAHPRIRIIANATAVDLLTLSHHGDQAEDRYAPLTCVGAHVLFAEYGQIAPIRARETILATGGAGQLYAHTTNPPGARGDGIAMCWRAGIRLSHMEYVQFHPTALYMEGAPRFLISEAMRGEGGLLMNRNGERFMKKYDEREELAPRDVVARAIHEELLSNGEPCVYLDLTHKPSEWIRERFPKIDRFCGKHGIDITTERIPVVPAAHYFCGGVLVDLDGRTSAERLWAVGEVSCTGVHGANRLASTSLLEALVWGARAAEAAAERINSGDVDYRFPEIAPWRMAEDSPDPALILQDWNTIKYTMWNYVGLIRTTKRLRRARHLLRELELEIDDFYAQSLATDAMIGLRNGITTARAVTLAALANHKSKGAHYRID